jgi:hypothetical protein
VRLLKFITEHRPTRCARERLSRHIVDGADIVGTDVRGRPVMRFEFAAEPWLLDKLAALRAAEENREDAFAS